MTSRILAKYNSLSIQVRATMWFFICSVLQRGISVITTPIFTRLMTTADYGQYSVFNSWLSIVQIVVSLNLSAGVYTMGIVKFKEDEKVFTSSLQGLTFVLSLAWTVVYLLFHDFWNSLFTLTTAQVLAMLVMVWASSAFHFWMTTQRNEFKYRKLVAVTLAVSIIQPMVGILLVVNAKDKVSARIFGVALVELIAYSSFFFIQLARGKKFFSANYWKYAILFNLPLIPHYLASSILASSDRIMIQRMVGLDAAGIYSLAYSISMIMTMVNDSLNKTMSPWLYQKIREERYDDMHRVVYPSLALIAFANWVLIAVAPEIIAIFAPPQYREAIYVIPPVAMSVYAQYLYLCFAPFEFYYGKRLWTTVSTLTSAVVNIGLNFIFISLFGYQAAGYTTLVCYIVNSSIHYGCMTKICNQHLGGVRPYDLKILITITGLFIALGLAYIPTYSNIYVRYGLTFLIVLIVFAQRKRIVPVVRMMIADNRSKRSSES